MPVAPRRAVRSKRLIAILAVSSLMSAAPRVSSAQASGYPSLQVPTASIRDYTAAIASGAGTTLLFQWREGVGDGMHVGLDAGLTDLRGSENLLLVLGGSFASELVRAKGEQPLDLLLTAGAGIASGGGRSILRFPAGISMGHTFELDQGMQLTPYVHPRVSLDVCSTCGGKNDNRTELSLNFDLGASFQVNHRFAVRAAAAFSGSEFFGDKNSFAVGFTWTPDALRK